MDLFNDLPEPKNTTESQATDELNENRKRESTESNERSNKKLNSTVGEKQIGSLSFRGYFAERQGERETMEDRHVIIEDYKKYLNNVPSDLESLSYYAVFDGHAGHRAADYCAENMHNPSREIF